MLKKLSSLLAVWMLLMAVLGNGVYAAVNSADTPYYYWSFEEGADTGTTGANPWHGGALGVWQGYYNDALSIADAPEGAGAQGSKTLKIDKYRSNGSNGVSTTDSNVIGMAAVPGNIISLWIYVDPAYVGDSIAMQDMNLRDWAVSGTTAGEIYASRTTAGNQIEAGWNNLRYQVPVGKTNMWANGRLTVNIRTLFNLAGVKALYPSMTDEQATAYYTQLNDNLDLEWYVDSIYIGPAAYEPEFGEQPAGFEADGLNGGPPEDDSPPVLSQGSASRLNGDSGAVTFISDKAGTAYYGIGTPPADTSGAGSTAVAGSNTIVIPLAGYEQAEVYVRVKDLEGRVSGSDFKVTIPAYIPDDPEEAERIPYFFWSFEEGALTGSAGISPWNGEALTPWQGYWNTSLATAEISSAEEGAHGDYALRLGKKRADGATGVSITDTGALNMARAPGHVVSAWVYVNPSYAAEGNLIMQDLNLRDWSSSSASAGERYDLRGVGSNNLIASGNEIKPGWNRLRYEVPAGKTDAWPLGRITFNIRTLFTAAAVQNLYPAMTEAEIADLIAQLSNDLSLHWYVDSVYIGPAAYEPQQDQAPVNFKADGLNYTKDSAAGEPEDIPGPAADPMLAYVSAAAQSNGDADGSLQSPYKTIGAAVQVTEPGARIIVGTGVYRETVRPKDGQLILGAPGENPVISGLDLVDNWTLDAATGLYRADMDWSLDSTYQTTGSKVTGGGNQVFIDGSMAYEARWPNAGQTAAPSEGGLFQFDKAAFDTVTLNTTAKTAVIKDSQLSELAGINLAGVTMWYISGQKWNSRPGTVLAHTGQNITINLNGEAANPTAQYYHPKPGNEYILYGHKALLDSDDEWYWDSVARKLYVRTDPADKQIESKRREIAIDLSGTKGVTIRGIGIRGATIVTSSGTEDAVIDGIKAEYINHAANFDNGNVYDEVNNGILLDGKRNILMNSEVAYAAGGLVTLQGEDNRLVNSYLHDADYTGGWASAVTLSGTNLLVSHNTITRAGRDIISMRQAKASIIEYNDLSYAGELCEDLGTLYTYSADGAGTEIRYNKIHDSEIANGIYLDNNSMNYLVHHNVSYNLKARSGLKNNSISSFNLFFNNTNYNEAPMGMVTITNYPMSAYGTRYYNNITGNNYNVAGDTAWNYNLQLTNAQAQAIFRNPGQGDFRLKEGLTTWYGAYSGKPLEGINPTGYIGAYEYDVSTGEIVNDFKTGHDFASPPVITAPQLTDTPYRNAVADGVFERSMSSDNYDIAAPWTKYGTGSVKLKRDSAFYVRNDGFGAHIAGEGTGIRQTVTGLKPNTDYIFTARVQSAQQSGVVSTLTGGRARVGVISDSGEHSTEAESSKLVIRANTSTNMPEWVQVELPFRTGGNTSVEVFAQVSEVAVNIDNVAILLPLVETDAGALLAEAIAQAENLLASVQDMPEAVSAAFRQRTEDARAVWNDPQASSSQLEAAAVLLKESADSFARKKELLLAVQSAQLLCMEMVFDGTDYNYPASAKTALEAVIDRNLTVLEETGASMEEISAAIEDVAAGKLVFFASIVMPSIDLYAKADMEQILSTGENWSRKGLSGDYAMDEDGYMSFRSSTGEGNNSWSKGATFYTGSRFGNVLFEADVDYTPAEGDWPAILMRAQVAQESMWGDNQDHYLTVFRSHNVELQKWINGAEDTAFRVTIPTEAIVSGVNKMQWGAVDVEQDGTFVGVRIFFYANGEKIYDFLDRSQTAIRGDGYLGLALYPPANPLRLRAVEAEPENPAVPAVALSGAEAVYLGQSMEATVGIRDLTAEEGMDALLAVVSYDPAKLLFATVTDDNGTPDEADDVLALAPEAVAAVRSGFQVVGSGIKPEEGQLLLLLMATGGDQPATGDGPVAVLRGQVRQEAQPGETELAATQAVYSRQGVSFPLDVSRSALQLTLILADKTVLSSLIVQAQALLDSAVIGNGPGEYPPGAAAALQSAIAAAAEVLERTSAVQEEVTAAAAELETAMAAFAQSVIPVQPADKAALQAGIAAAQALAGRAVEGDKLGMYAIGTKQTLLAAISAAEAVNLATGVSQTAVDSAAEALSQARILFENGFISMIPGQTRITLLDLSLLSPYLGVTADDGSVWSIVGKADLFDENEISIRSFSGVARMIVLDWLKP